MRFTFVTSVTFGRRRQKITFMRPVCGLGGLGSAFWVRGLWIQFRILGTSA
jgi:hypothetical protein